MDDTMFEKVDSTFVNADTMFVMVDATFINVDNRPQKLTQRS